MPAERNETATAVSHYLQAIIMCSKVKGFSLPHLLTPALSEINVKTRNERKCLNELSIWRIVFIVHEISRTHGPFYERYQRASLTNYHEAQRCISGEQ